MKIVIVKWLLWFFKKKKNFLKWFLWSVWRYFNYTAFSVLILLFNFSSFFIGFLNYWLGLSTKIVNLYLFSSLDGILYIIIKFKDTIFFFLIKNNVKYLFRLNLALAEFIQYAVLLWINLLNIQSYSKVTLYFGIRLHTRILGRL